MQLPENQRFFGRNASILLDALRFAAALAVALTHMTLFLAAAPLIPERSANTAVCVFFVLSGFVIRYVTVTRVPTGRDYCIDRITRIYSVVVPALLLTMLLEWTAWAHAPAVFRLAANPTPWAWVPMQMLQNLTFTVGWWGWGATPLANGAFWSLSFECVYYALYGLIRYAPRARWVLVPLLLLLVGPSIALLFPIWLLGAALYDVYAKLHTRRHSLPWAALALLVYGGLLFLFRRSMLHWLNITDVNQRSLALTRFVAGFSWGRAYFGGAPLHWLDRLSVSFYVSGLFVALAMLPLLLVLDGFLPAATKSWAKRVRLVADSTFTLYLLHLPVLLWLMTMTGRKWTNWREGWAILGLTILLSILLASLFDRLKNVLREGFSRLLPRPQTRVSRTYMADAG